MNHGYEPDPRLVRPYLLDVNGNDHQPPPGPPAGPAVRGRAAVPKPIRLQMTGYRDDIGLLLADLDRFWRLEDVSDPMPYIGRRVLVTATVFRQYPLSGGGELR